MVIFTAIYKALFMEEEKKEKKAKDLVGKDYVVYMNPELTPKHHNIRNTTSKVGNPIRFESVEDFLSMIDEIDNDILSEEFKGNNFREIDRRLVDKGYHVHSNAAGRTVYRWPHSKSTNGQKEHFKVVYHTDNKIKNIRHLNINKNKLTESVLSFMKKESVPMTYSVVMHKASKGDKIKKITIFANKNKTDDTKHKIHLINSHPEIKKNVENGYHIRYVAKADA